MKKLLLFLLVICALLTSCEKTSNNNGNADISENHTYTDSLGRSVTISEAERVSVLIGSFADLWCIAGGKDNIVSAANDTWTQFDLGLSDNVVNIGSAKVPSLEKIISSDPDLIIASANTSADVALMENFENIGIPVLYFSVSNFYDYLNMLDVCTDITGHKENYEKYGLELEDEINIAKSMADGSSPSVLYVRASASKVKVKNSQDSVLGEMLKDLGCVNIADSNNGLLENLSMETIIREDPQWIFCVLQSSTPEKAQASLEKALLSDPAWESLTAVKEGRFVMLDQNLYNMKPNRKWAEAYTNLAEIIYGKK